MRKNNPSQEQLIKSIERRLKHLMISTLEKLEDTFPDMDGERQFEVLKGNLRTIFNDVIRAQRDEINDYEVEYRPLRLNNDNTLAMTQTFLQTVQKIEFGFRGEKPFIKIYSSLDHNAVLQAIRSEFDAGVVFQEQDSLILEIVGIDTCVDRVLIIMDKYRLHESVRPAYREWRSKVVKNYRS